MTNGPLDTGQFRIDEILGQKVNPVEAQVFENRKSRVRLIFGLSVWLVAIIFAIITALALSALLQTVF